MSFSKVMRLLGGPFAMFAITMALSDLPHAIDAAHNDGRPGTFTAEREECRDSRGGKSCKFRGTFQSDDGEVRLTDVFMDNDIAEEIGQEVPAQAVDGQSHKKVYEMSSRDWLWILIISVASLGYLCWWGWEFVIQPLRNRRAEPG